VRSADEIVPPTTTTAIGRCVSLPSTSPARARTITSRQLAVERALGLDGTA